MAFFSPPIFKWEEPVAHQRRKYFIKSWPTALTTMHNHVSVYETQFLRQDGKTAVGIPFNKIKECSVTVEELPDEKPYFQLVFTPTQTRIWGIFGCNFLTETALDDPLLLGQVLALLHKNGVKIVDHRKA